MSIAAVPAGSAVRDRAATVEALRRKIAQLPAQRDRTPQHRAQPRVETAAAAVAFPLPGRLSALFPGGGVRVGQTVAYTGGYGVLVSILAAATAAGKRCAVVGYAHLGMAAIGAEGGDLSRVAYVPQPGADPGAVVSVLLDGMDLVVLDPACARIPPSRARVLAGRARSAGAVLLVGGRDWPHADVLIESRTPQAFGLDCGYGRITVLEFPVRATAKHVAGRQSVVGLQQHGLAARTIAATPHAAQVDIVALDRHTQKAG